MIRIFRDGEPDSLILARDEHLARAAIRGHAPAGDEFSGYRVAFSRLHQVQRSKCVYCELITPIEGQPVEHYRPKSEVSDVDWVGLRAVPRPSPADRADAARFLRGLPPTTDDAMERVKWKTRSPGYWWLAWTWENQLYSCHRCNSGIKGVRFPQQKGAVPLTEHAQPPAAEKPLLIDPTQADPMDEIQFVKGTRGRWLPVARNGSPSGAWTIRLFKLDSNDAYLESYRHRVRDLEACAATARFDRALSVGKKAAITAAWNRLLKWAFDPGRPLLALAHDWLDARYNAAGRARWNLSLHRPFLGVPPAPSPQPTLSALPFPAGASPLTQDRIRVLRNCRRPSATDPCVVSVKDLVRDLRTLDPGLPSRALASLLNKPLTDIAGALSQLGLPP